MDAEAFDKRLGQISTIWTLVKNAHEAPADVQMAAQHALLERYQPAVYRYLLKLVGGNADAADEVFQEFALRFVRGDFRNADPSRGRFRDLVKTALINLSINHRKREGRPAQRQGDPEALAAVADDADQDQEFLLIWQKQLLDRAWEALAATDPEGRPPFFAVLRYRTEHPEVPAEQIAEMFTAHFKPEQPYTATGIRKVLQRARERFVELLVDEVGHSIRTTALDDLEQELRELGFWAYCHKVVTDRRAR